MPLYTPPPKKKKNLAVPLMVVIKLIQFQLINLWLLARVAYIDTTQVTAMGSIP